MRQNVTAYNSRPASGEMPVSAVLSVIWEDDASISQIAAAIESAAGRAIEQVIARRARALAS
jgi:hypothetical protein